jgi:hypothetical protein
MTSFAKERLREMIADLKASAVNFTTKLNSARLDVTQSSGNKDAFLRFKTRAMDADQKIKSVECSDIARQARRRGLHAEVFSREVLVDLEQSSVVKAELDQLFQDLDNFKARAIRQENINKMGMSSLEMLKIDSVRIADCA